MKPWLVGLLVLVSPSAFAQSTSAPELQFDSVPNFIKLPPDMYLGEASGVAMNSKGNILVYSRGGSSQGPAYGNTASQLLEFDRDGNFIREVGKGLYAWSFAHTVRFDKDDNIWATDKGSDMLVKMNPAGRVMMVFGRKSEASDEDAHPLHRPNPPLPAQDGRFRQPTDIAFDKAGNGYISDGYINSRVAKISKDGDWVKQWGTKGKGDGQFDTLHSIASDNNDNIYVADRGNRRVQVFDTEGTLKYKFSIDIPPPADAKPAIGNPPNLTNYLTTGGTQTPGAPWAICITPGPNQVAFIADAFPGRIYKVALDGKGTVLGWFGKSGKQLKQFGWVHQIACPSENEIYVSEILNWRVQKLLISSNQRAEAR
jgi:NHL repeat